MSIRTTVFLTCAVVIIFFALAAQFPFWMYPQLDDLNVMRLDSPESAVLSAVVFDALIIVGLIPLALRGVRFRATAAASVLRRNLLVYGLGGLVAPFVGIKLIDVFLAGVGVGS